MEKCIRMMRMRENIQSAPSWMMEERRYREEERYRQVERGRTSEQRGNNIQNAIVWIVYVVRTWTESQSLSFDTFQSYSNLFQNVLIRAVARSVFMFVFVYVCVCVRAPLDTHLTRFIYPYKQTFTNPNEHIPSPRLE